MGLDHTEGLISFHIKITQLLTHNKNTAELLCQYEEHIDSMGAVDQAGQTRRILDKASPETPTRGQRRNAPGDSQV